MYIQYTNQREKKNYIIKKTYPIRNLSQLNSKIKSSLLFKNGKKD